ncbi:MAG TPA: DNA polymerase III subunit delta' C-terminal domain-containing protein [Candidatus Limnocylindrales bacterium]|nr:DNA polymerase III subunit delta' C-terminal domain-containing protein [Candidatus Limnocylindrales bacterium]
MGFGEILGNERIVSALRGMLRRERVASALLFTGPRGIGKYTLARMFAQAANCERLKDDFCGECAPCRRMAALADPQPLIEAGLEERGADPDPATVERMPLLVETNPDVWLIVPDPVRAKKPVARPMIRVGQLRAVQRAAYFKPQGRRRVFILDGADTMRWTDADVFLKILEEPPETATLILLAPSPDAVLQTIRSRCLQFHFAPVAAAEIETFLKERTPLKAAERRLAGQLSDGSPGVALRMNLEESARLRRSALRLIELGIGGEKYGEIFSATAQLAKQEKESFENILELFYSLLTDLLEFSQGPKSSLPRNPDLSRELEALSKKVDFNWVSRAARGLDQLESRLRRNIGRQLGLDAYIASLGVR